MTAPVLISAEPSSGKPEADKRKGPRPYKKRQPYGKLGGDEIDGDARRLAAAILEVLAGARTPTEAAESLGISPPRYYTLEDRALKALVAACRRKSRGRVRTPEAELERLRAEVRRLERECGRWQALLRAAQRTVGLSPPVPAKPAPKGKHRPHRSRVARALRAAGALKSDTKLSVAKEPLEKGGEAGHDRVPEGK